MPGTGTEVGLRERKKQRTRELITETARRLFAERGFEAVTVAEIAGEAEVSPATVFNYFPTKEDLFYGRLESLEEELLATIRERPPEQGVLDAFAAFLRARQGALADDDPEASERLRTMTRVLTASPALLARERQVFDAAARALAELLAEETKPRRDDVVCRMIANALVGLHRALVDHVREQVLAGAPVDRIRGEVLEQAELAFEQLGQGLGTFGVRAAGEMTPERGG